MNVMGDTAKKSNFLPAPSSVRANPSPGQRNRQDFRSSGDAGRGGRRDADDKVAPRRNDVGTYGWSSEEVKRQGRNGRSGERRGQGRGGNGRPVAAQRRDNSAERFIPAGSLPQWSDPFPRPERIGGQHTEVLEVTGSHRAIAEPVMRQSPSAEGGFFHEGEAISSDLTQQGRSPLRDEARIARTRTRWGDSSSPLRGESRSQEGDSRRELRRSSTGNRGAESRDLLQGESRTGTGAGDWRSPSRRQLRRSSTGNRVAEWRDPLQGQSRTGSGAGDSRIPWTVELQSTESEARASQSRYPEGPPIRGGPRSAVNKNNTKLSGVDATSLPPRESVGSQRGVPAAQSAGRGRSQNSQKTRQMLGGYGGVISDYSGGHFQGRRDGDREHPAQRDRMGRGKTGETRGQQTAWVDVDSTRGSSAIGSSQARKSSMSSNFSVALPHSSGDKQQDYSADGNVEVLRNLNKGHWSRKSWGTDSLTEDDLGSIVSEESSWSRKGSHPRSGYGLPRRITEDTGLSWRTNQSETRSESLERGENRSRRERMQSREGFRKENDSVGCEAAAKTSLAETYRERRHVRGIQAVTKQAGASSHGGLRRITNPGSIERLQKNSTTIETEEADRARLSDTQAMDGSAPVNTAMHSESRNLRASWRQARQKGDNGLDETHNRQVSQNVSSQRHPRLGVDAGLDVDSNKGYEYMVQQRIVVVNEDHSGEVTAVSPQGWGGKTAGPLNDWSQPQAKELSSRRGQSMYKSVAVDMVGGDGEILPSIVGTCPDMCPERERGRRERLRDLAVLERVNGQLGKTSRDLAVKKFCRTLSSVELQQSDVRPLAVLRMTLHYLWNFLDRKDIPFKMVHDFLFDRTRAVRQDIGMQQLVSRQAIGICEEIVRFHIISERELHEQSLSDRYFESDLNPQQLSKALFTLLTMYAAYDFKDGDLPCEAEFHAYFVLLNLGKIDQIQADALAMWLSLLQRPLLVSSEMSFARSVLRCFRMGNFQKFFQLVEQATYLQACLLELVFNQVRAHALAVLNQSSYKLHPYPIADLAERLLIQEEDLKSLCTFYGLPVGVQNASQEECLLVKQAQLLVPEKAAPWYHCPQIEAKRPPSHLVAVTGFKELRQTVSPHHTEALISGVNAE